MRSLDNGATPFSLEIHTEPAWLYYIQSGLGKTGYPSRRSALLSIRQAKVESCPATEGRLASEFRRNPYGKAMLLATMARFRTNREEQEGLIAEAAALLRRELRRERERKRERKSE